MRVYRSIAGHVRIVICVVAVCGVYFRSGIEAFAGIRIGVVIFAGIILHDELLIDRFLFSFCRCFSCDGLRFCVLGAGDFRFIGRVRYRFRCFSSFRLNSREYSIDGSFLVCRQFFGGVLHLDCGLFNIIVNVGRSNAEFFVFKIVHIEPPLLYGFDYRDPM